MDRVKFVLGFFTSVLVGVGLAAGAFVLIEMAGQEEEEVYIENIAVEDEVPSEQEEQNDTEERAEQEEQAGDSETAKPWPQEQLIDIETVTYELQRELIIPGNQLENPPDVINAVYLTSWSAGTASRIQYVINLSRVTEVNAVVIDIKDYSGHLSYRTAVPAAATYGAETRRISNINAVINLFHEHGIYVIGRVTVFQDPIFANARPDLSVHSEEKLALRDHPEAPLSQETLWTDNLGLSWLDPAAREAWDYHIAIAQDAAARGFDEINFDYIRFPSDGKLADMHFPLWDRQTTQRREVLREFFEYLSGELEGIAISADLFGLVTINPDDLGIGQVIEDSFGYFDYIAPMVYPSHYAGGFIGYPNPGEHPYDVVWYSLSRAQNRLNVFNASGEERHRMSLIRPWLQDFSIRGVAYGPAEVRAQIQASKDALGEQYNGYMLWSPRNIYTAEALY